MKLKVIVFFLFILGLTAVRGQEENPFISFDIPSQNLLKFNRFLINPTFSTVREDNSYINLYHRNQWIQFEDSPEVYLASYSGRVGDRTGLGLGLYQQNLGVITNFGILANYAYGVRLTDRINLTFGFNVSFFSSGLDTGEIFPGMPDPALASIEDSSLLSFQPGFNLSLGSFDFGLYAENLFDYNLRTSESVTDFNEKTFSGHLMYTRKFKNSSGIFENGRFSALARGRKQGDRDVNLSGSLIVDLPKLGWIQGGYDDFFGASAGIGFNLTKRLSLGYTIEKGLNDGIQNLGTTHELTFAYSFQPNLTDDRVELNEEELDDLAQLEEKIQEKDEVIASKDEELAQIKKNLEENNMILAELILKQDSLERAVNKDIEKRFYNLIKTMKRGQPANNTAVARNDNNRNRTSTKNRPTFSNQPRNINVVSTSSYNDDDFILAARANNIRQRTIKNLQGVDGGYYLIVNVYSQKTNGRFYRDKFVNKLRNDGLDPDYFLNTRNNLNYVYLKRFDNWQDAIAAYKSDLNNTYTDDMWIMNVQNESTLRYADRDTRPSSTAKRGDESRKKAITARKPAGDKQRVTSPATKTPPVNNTGRVVNRPGDVRKENTDRVNAPNKTNSRITARDKGQGNTGSPVKKSTVTPKSDKDAVASNVNEKTEDEIRKQYSTSRKRKQAKKGKIVNIASLDEGYYIIANVFAVPSNATRFVDKLKKQGLDAAYFVNPENNYRYVYLKKHSSWNSALASYYSNLNDSYFEDIWIMRVNTDYIL